MFVVSLAFTKLNDLTTMAAFLQYQCKKTTTNKTFTNIQLMT